MLFGLLDLNIYMSIPVITKILLIFILDNLSLGRQIKFKLGIGIFSFLFSNMLRIVLEKSCTKFVLMKKVFFCVNILS